MYISFPRHHRGELSCDIIVGDRRCVREIEGAEACFMNYDVTRAKLSQAKCPLPRDLCGSFGFRLTIIEIHVMRQLRGKFCSRVCFSRNISRFILVNFCKSEKLFRFILQLSNNYFCDLFDSHARDRHCLIHLSLMGIFSEQIFSYRWCNFLRRFLNINFYNYKTLYLYININFLFKWKDSQCCFINIIIKTNNFISKNVKKHKRTKDTKKSYYFFTFSLFVHPILKNHLFFLETNFMCMLMY